MEFICELVSKIDRLIDIEKKVGADSNLSDLYDVDKKDGLSFLRL